MKTSLDENTLQALIGAGVIREAIITRTKCKGGHKWAILVKYGMNTQTLKSRREPVRLFNTLDTAAKLLHELGLHQMQIDYA